MFPHPILIISITNYFFSPFSILFSDTLLDHLNGKIFYGIKTGLNEAFVIDEIVKDQILHDEPQSIEFIKPYLAGRDIKRYEKPIPDKYLILIPKGWTNNNSYVRDKWKWFKEKYPILSESIKKHELKAKERTDQGDYWWELRSCDYYKEFEKPKFMLPDISLKGNFIFDEENKYCLNTCYILSSNDKYLLGLLNSTLISYFYGMISSTYRGGYLRFIYQYLAQIPIKEINFADLHEKKTCENVIMLVDQMLESKKQLATAKTDSEKEYLEKKCKGLDRQIDALVYQLYGLTEEEIKIVEGL